MLRQSSTFEAALSPSTINYNEFYRSGTCWLAGWLAVWLAGLLAGWQAGSQQLGSLDPIPQGV